MLDLAHARKQIEAQIEVAKKTSTTPLVAAFDADGTLWDTDMGEDFFDYQINNCGLALPSDPWAYYKDTKAVDPRKAYLWLAQINKGQTLSDVLKWAETSFLDKNPFPFLSFQKSLIEYLHNQGFQVYIVTASIRWAVIPGAQRLGIPESRVLGIQTKIKNGVITDEQEGPITWREGKAQALQAATGGVAPILAAGNTTGDLTLIDSASHLKLAILSQKPGEHLYETEMELQTEGAKRNWLCLDLSDNSLGS